MENTLNTEPELGQHDDNETQETPAGQSEEQPPAPAAEKEADPLKKAQDELAEARDKYVRLYAEFENHRRRTAKEKLEMIMGANEQLLKALLPIADDFERAEKSLKDRGEKEIEGFMLIRNKFKKLLDQNSVKQMDAQ